MASEVLSTTCLFCNTATPSNDELLYHIQTVHAQQVLSHEEGILSPSPTQEYFNRPDPSFDLLSPMPHLKDHDYCSKSVVIRNVKNEMADDDDFDLDKKVSEIYDSVMELEEQEGTDGQKTILLHIKDEHEVQDVPVPHHLQQGVVQPQHQQQQREFEMIFQECDVCHFRSFDQLVMADHVFRNHKEFLCEDKKPANYQPNVTMDSSKNQEMPQNNLEFPPWGRRPTNCLYCGYYEPDTGELWRHIRQFHLNIYGHICALCGMGTSSLEDLRIHVIQEHNDLSRINECFRCRIIFSDLDSLRTHLTLEHMVMSYNCPLCPFRATTSSLVARHTWEYHQQVHVDQNKQNLLELR